MSGRRRRYRLTAAALTALGSALVWLFATQLFPYHSINHDEGVYLQQAAMFLEGQLFLYPPEAGSYRPWFFVVKASGRGAADAVMYPKYGPVPAAMFALGKLVTGHFRASLVAIAAGNVALTYALVTEAFDRRHGVLAAGALLASPLFLIESAVFLPYAPTTFWNLLFAVAYVRAHDRESRRYAVLAGTAVGIAFFARPYTAVLFATPFILHSLYALVAARQASPDESSADWRSSLRGGWIRLPGSRGRLDADLVGRTVLVAAFGLVGVAATLAYNWATTGDPFLFPYLAFAPEDGLGFGHHEILGYERDYTPTLALRANYHVLRAFVTRWFVAGSLGAALAVLGVVAVLWRAERPSFTHPFAPGHARLLLLGIVPSVILGNVYFWGNLNALGDIAERGDGLIYFLGPYYHFDLLVPGVAFLAHGTLLLGERIPSIVEGRRLGEVATQGRVVAVVAVVVLAVATPVAAGPIRTNAEATEALKESYEPFAETDLENTVVFLPPIYGDWLNHPFQALRNDPGFDGETVYVVRDGPDDLSVMERYPDRTYYRYVYRGEWAPFEGRSVTGYLQRVRRVTGDALTLRTRLGVPFWAQSVSVTLATDDGRAYFSANVTGRELTVSIHLTPESASVSGQGLSAVGDRSVALDGRTSVRLLVHVDGGPGRRFTYRVRLPVAVEDGTVRSMTPYLEVCRIPTFCGGSAAYVPGAHRDGVFVETRFQVPNSSRHGA